MDPRQYLEKLFQRTLEACTPSAAIKKAVSSTPDKLMVNGTAIDTRRRPIYVLSVGKASLRMFEGLQDIFGNNITDHLIIMPNRDEQFVTPDDTIMYGSHPLPDEKSVEAGRRAVVFVKNVPDNALLICLISGGASSLMCLPAEGITIGELQDTFQQLNHSGADIHQINTVRKHCSQIKGGQLLREIPSGVTLVDLIISDAPGDDPGFIGSGPTTPDSTTYRDAYHILLHYELWEDIPESVRQHIERGLAGSVPQIFRPEYEATFEHHSVVISSASGFAQKAADIAHEDGYHVFVADEPFVDNIERVASDILQTVSEIDEKRKPAISFFYGESTIEVAGGGKGGRNQEMALRGALEIAGDKNSCWLCAGTDGIDGPTDAAGAVVDGNTVPTAVGRGMNPQKYLTNNDSYHFHSEMGTLFKTGPTGNNLMDVVWVLSVES